MESREVHAFLRTRSWGMLATVAEGRPYAVPVAFGLEGETLCFASGPGRKLRNLESNPAVCLTIADVEDGNCWRSVVVMGEIEWVEDLAGRLRALRALQRQRGGEAISLQDAARFARARIARIVPSEMTGRSRG